MRALIIGAVLALAACGGAEKPSPSPADILEGVARNEQVIDCIAEWNTYVDEWNVLTEERDAKGADVVVVDGVEYEDGDAYFTAKGYPLTYEEACS